MFGHNTLMQNQTISLTPKATSCPECKSRRIVRDYEKGELLCASCGLIIVESIHDMGPEWRAFDSEQKEKKARGGAPLKFMRPNKGLVTEIDQYNRDIRGGKISPKKQAQLYRMRKWHKRVSIATSMERNLVIALAELDRLRLGRIAHGRRYRLAEPGLAQSTGEQIVAYAVVAVMDHLGGPDRWCRRGQRFLPLDVSVLAILCIAHQKGGSNRSGSGSSLGFWRRARGDFAAGPSPARVERIAPGDAR